MSKFFVGQRVRIIWSLAWPELAGQEGRIIGADVSDAVTNRSEWQVAPDSWGSDLCPYACPAGRFAPSSGQLEPILPEGAAPSEYTFHRLMDSLQEVSA